MLECTREFLRQDKGAIAATYAIALSGLLVIGGVAFDYARFATLDSELQSAADEAALAAATQLDGRAGAITGAQRAQNAVNQYFANSTSAVVNRTLMANDNGGSAISSVSFAFYASFNSATDAFGAVATTDAAAKVVKVTINARKAFYAFTPIVAAYNSGDVTADAVAGLQSAVCKIPPLMICNPNEATSSTFPMASDRGKGVKLEAGAGGGNAWGPGNYGYLQFGNGPANLEDALGSNSIIDNCNDQSTLQTKTGTNASVTTALNTRFDIYDSGLTNYCTGSTCSPAMNTRKDLIHTVPTSWIIGNGNNSTCSLANPVTTPKKNTKEWVLPTTQYLGTSTPVPTNMGLPRDICHATSMAGSCSPNSNRFGDGVWDRALYFQINHPGIAASVAQVWAGRATLGELSRYDVYRWELATAGMLSNRSAEAVQGTTFYAVSAPSCGTGLPASNTQKDRRVLTVAVVNCTANGINGTSPVNDIANWADIFLVEPSINRTYTQNVQIYGEVIGVATKPDGSNSFQYYGRQKAVLLQ